MGRGRMMGKIRGGRRGRNAKKEPGEVIDGMAELPR
jgi:hypothetical protein